MANNNTEIINVAGITKSFGLVQVLKGIDLRVRKGEIVAIAGASGAGKTTLLQIIGTLSSADKGIIEIENQRIEKLSEKQLSRFRNLRIGFVFQFHHLLPEFSAIENICLPAFIADLSKNVAEDKAKELLSYLKLTHRMHHRPSELSGGEQQRVAVARALINNPAVILADEPSGNLDSKSKYELHDLFFNLREKFNQTFIIVTHDSGLANISDRVITIVDGKIE